MAQQKSRPPRKDAARVVNASKSGSKRGFYLLIGVAGVAGILVLTYLSTRGKSNPPIVLNPSLAPVASAGYVMGSETAPIEVIEFGDFECPGCGKFAELTEPDVRAQFVNTGKIRFRFIDYPLNMHPNTLNASVAAACADIQGKFWPMHDMLYARQADWNGIATSNPDRVIKEIAHALPGIDVAKFDQCLDQRETLPKVQAHLKLAADRNLPGTPSFVIGGVLYEDMASLDVFKRVVDSLTKSAAPKAAATTPGKSTKKP